jgi:predicted secreted protein
MTTIQLTSADSGRTIDVRVGDEIVILLPRIATTGYQWHVERLDAPLTLEAESYRPDSPPQFGSGGVSELRFRAAGPGHARLELKYWQPWEGDRSVTERFALDVNVTA